MRKRRNPDAGFKAHVALEAVKGGRTVSELAAEYGVHGTLVILLVTGVTAHTIHLHRLGNRPAPSRAGPVPRVQIA